MDPPSLEHAAIIRRVSEIAAVANLALLVIRTTLILLRKSPVAASKRGRNSGTLIRPSSIVCLVAQAVGHVVVMKVMNPRT